MESKNKKEFQLYENYRPDLQPLDQPKNQRFNRINTWLKKHQKPVFVAVVVLAIGVGSTLTYLFSNLEFAPITEASIKQASPKFYSPLTGAEVSEADTKRPVTAAMLENSPEARPQSGLKQAGVVFESVAEGGITRFLLLYQESKPLSIGPIRSIRPQFASWAAAFDAGVAHVGGSDIPLKKLRSGQIKDLDQFFNASTYTRVSDRRAPHNVYSSDEKLQALNQKKGYTSSNFVAWKRKTKETPNQTPTVRAITVPVSTGQFATSYQWEQTSNTYLRSQGGKPHLDREEGHIAPKVILVLQVPHDSIKDSNNYTYPDVIGGSTGWLFQNGIVTEVSWSKPSDKEQIKLTTADGKSAELNPGQVWVVAVRPGKPPTWQ